MAMSWQNSSKAYKMDILFHVFSQCIYFVPSDLTLRRNVLTLISKNTHVLKIGGQPLSNCLLGGGYVIIEVPTKYSSICAITFLFVIAATFRVN